MLSAIQALRSNAVRSVFVFLERTKDPHPTDYAHNLEGVTVMWKKSEPEETRPQPATTPQPPQAPQVQAAQPVRNPAPQLKEKAMIGPTITIKGDLSGEEDLQIEGRVEGKIDLPRHSVTVGKSGRIKADVYGKTITVEGEVEGNLFGEEQLVLRQSSTVRGNITAPRVSLEDGANFKGSIDMSSKEKPTPTPSKPTVSRSEALGGTAAVPGPKVDRPNGKV
jgi:cytoskeletal protein CcmA (bactofilin family)